ncbi:MAG TPA: cytochrome C [Azospirillum sp.]|nr:cytochrome C [Azospirillum sp.]
MRAWIGTAAALLLASGAALASEFERVPPVTHGATLKECGECHMAYQPGLLPAASWTRIMDGLADHFGDKATLPAEVAASIRDYLARNAGGGDGRLIRITEQRWWLRKHDFDPAVWKRKTVGAKGNCETCHRDAAKGLYEDD